jgi:error-prone DNA polymerase
LKPPAKPKIVPLWNKTHYSFLHGASSPEELVDAAHACGFGALAITDVGGVYGIVRAHRRAQQHGLKLLVGAQLPLEKSAQAAAAAAPTPTVLALATDVDAYGQLCHLLSQGHRQAAQKGAPWFSSLQLQQAGSGLLWLCDDPLTLTQLAAAHPGRIYALVARHLLADDRRRHRALLAAARRCGVPAVAANEVLYHHPTRRPLQDILTCIRHNLSLHDAGTRLRQNDEYALRPAALLRRRFADAPEMLQRSFEVAERCTFSLSALRYRYPQRAAPDQPSLRTLCVAGAQRRYGTPLPAAASQQLEHELQLIEKLEYGGYFLTMHAIVCFCRQQRILCQGRGSAANSIVCFALDITAIDPLAMGFLFERFISLERAEPPDIDLDIEHQRREEVIQWVYQRYGRRHAAMVANVVRFRPRSAIQAVGKVLGVAPHALVALSKLTLTEDQRIDVAQLRAVGLDPTAPVIEKLTIHAQELLGTPRHLSVHPGGFLLGEQPIETLVPIEPSTMPGRTVIQWDKQDVEDMALFKVDLLGLGALTHIRRSLALLAQHQHVSLEMATVPHDDPATFAMIRRAATVGVFQIESRAQMAMLPRLQPRQFYDLVVEVAIVRPGPIQGDMVHPYLRRRLGLEAVDCPHPSLRQILGKTYGVPIFQEQVMKIAMQTAGYSPGEADQLRRDMAAWHSGSRIEKHHDVIVARMVQRGISRVFAERFFSQLRGFGEYGFPESHAASFALIAYMTAYLKCHHPAAFYCGLLNSQPMGFYSPATIVGELQRDGLVALPVDVNASDWDCSLEKHLGRWAVRMGLAYVTGLSRADRGRWESLRQNNPPHFDALGPLQRHARFGPAGLLCLAKAGALASLGLLRRDAVWAVKTYLTQSSDTLPIRPQAPQVFAPLQRNQAILWDHRIARHSVHGHVVQALRSSLPLAHRLTAAAVNALPSAASVHYVGLVISRQRPQTASGVVFFTLEDETGLVNLVLFKPVFHVYNVVAKTAAILGVRGKIQQDPLIKNGATHLLVEHLWRPVIEAPILPHLRHEFPG